MLQLPVVQLITHRLSGFLFPNMFHINTLPTSMNFHTIHSYSYNYSNNQSILN